MTQQHWWQSSIIYQIYPRSFMDANGDGIGDLQGIINKLDYLNDGSPDSLGIDAIWISPFYPSPMKDFGYDIADYQSIDPMFGDLETFDKLIAEAHKRNIKIIIDYVPNHTSDEHAWFVESRSSRTNPKRNWYIWKDAKPDGTPPNNWGSVFGGSAWEWDDTTQQYYFHQFVREQPDLNWRNPEVRQAMYDVLRFWMDSGVDGFRMDVVYMVWKHPEMPDQPINHDAIPRGENDIFSTQHQIYSQNYEGVHDIMRELRNVLDEYSDKVMIGEIWLSLEERMKYYGQSNDEFHMPFNFDFIVQGNFSENPTVWHAETFRKLVNDYESALPQDSWPNYVMGSHDVQRLASRLASEQRARVAAMMLLTLRGTPTLYMGDEIGMINGIIAPDQIQDPQGINLGAEHTRDFCRTPIQWNDTHYAGFSIQQPWLPVHPDYKTQNVAAQLADPMSILAFYKMLTWYRRAHASLQIGDYQAIQSPEGTFAYLREYQDERHLICLNFTNQTKQLALPGAGEIVVSTTIKRRGDVFKTAILNADEGIIIRLHEGD